MEFLDKRIRVICTELKKLSVTKCTALREIYKKEGFYVRPVDADNSGKEWVKFDSQNDHWKGYDKHDWFRVCFSVPKEFDGLPLWFNLRTQLTEGDDAKNPQFLLFANDIPVQGIDINHRSVLLDGAAKTGKEYKLDLQGYTGILFPEFNLFFELISVDKDIEGLYYDLSVPLDAFDRMDKDSKIRMDIERVLNDTVNLLDLRNPYSEEFYISVKEARKYIGKKLYEEMAGYDDVIATCIGHTHIDVAWWWTVAQTREKVARSFSTALKLMEEYPEYRFMSSQPQLYEFIKERYPDIFEKIKEKVRSRQWEAEGGMWLEADCNLTSGESLVRQFLYGKKFFREEFGTDNKILWLPDVFGYSGALPQIMKKAGIDYFMTTKLAWNQFNKIPNDTFLWRGIDGTEIFTHLITTLGIGQKVENFFTTYNGLLHPDSIMGGWERYQNKDMNNDILISFGYGDGGGGPTREMLEIARRMGKGIKGIPKVRQEFSIKFFNELWERVSKNKRLPKWEGELYFEYHRGTYTSMARNKRANRKSEIMMMDLELMYVLAKEKGLSYAHEDIDKMWKTILLNQFHDILPGTSIHEVYEVTKEEYKELATKGDNGLEACFKTLNDTEDGVTVYNTLGFDRDGIVCMDDLAVKVSVQGKELLDESGNRYTIQNTGGRYSAYLTGIPAKGWKHYDIVEAAKTFADTPFTVDKHSVDTPFYQIKFDDKGNIISLFDKDNLREVIKEGEKANLFRLYEDKPIYYDNWDIDIFYTEKYWDVEELTAFEWKEEGNVEVTLHLEKKFSNSVIKQNIHFYADSRIIEFDTYVDFKEHQHLLKVHFPLDIHTDEATFDIQFGNIKRKTHANTSWDVARFESCGQKWVDLSEGHYGVSIINDCKYGHSIKESDMALTLIKSGIEPNKEADYEEHYFKYAILPHKGDWKEGKTVQEAYKFNFPTYVVPGCPDKKEFGLLSVSEENVILETVKEAEDGEGIILRMYEVENALTRCTIKWNAQAIKEVYECNLLEEKERKLKADKNSFEISIKPYEIKTYRIVV